MTRRLVFSLLLSSLVLSAQAGGGLQGVVLDPSGAPAPGVRIAVSTASQVTVGVTQSGADGRFSLPGLAPGRYTLDAEKSGFLPLRMPVVAGDPPITVRLSLSPVAAEVTVSAEASGPALASAVAQPVSLIPREELYQRAQVLSEAAEGQPGVHQLRTAPVMGAFFVRGLTGNKVAVYRDGVRYSNAAQRGGVSTFFNLLNPETLDAVEVLRGPNSAQYGSDSLGGAVAALSRPAEFAPSGGFWRAQFAPWYSSAAHAFGSSSGISYGGSRAAFHTTLSALRSNTLRTGGGLDSHAAVTRFLGLPSTILGERLPDTAFTGYGGSFHAQARLSDSSQLVGHYERSQQDGAKRYDQLLGGDGNWIAELRNLMLDFAYLRYERFAIGPFDQLSITGSYNAQREERVNQGGQGNPSGSITHQYEKTRVMGAQFFLDKRFRQADWLIGGEGYAERVTAPSFQVAPLTGVVRLVRPRIPDGARYDAHGLYTQASWEPARSRRVRLSGALRFGGGSYGSRAARSPLVGGQPLWPDDSLAANAVTGRAGAVVWLTSRAGVHANYSRGFRAPNITDLGSLGLQGNGQYETSAADLAGRNATIGDRADDQAVSTGQSVEKLRPEVADNLDLGARLRTSRLEADLSGFWLRLDNSIVSQTLILPPGAVGQPLGEQIISRQLASGAVFVPLSASPVLIRANFSGARMRGWEHRLRLHLSRSWSLAENMTYVRSEEPGTGVPPDIEPGVPPFTVYPALTWRPPGKRFWAEAYATLAGRQDRLSSLALSDRRIGNPRSRSSIQSFFNNGARTRGLVANGILLPTGETLAEVQNRVLGGANSAPQFTAIPGYAVWSLRGGITLSERTDLFANFSNILDKNYRGIGWGIDGPGRGVTVRVRHRF
jgi:outer membrane receptor protein involved in Fe transport